MIVKEMDAEPDDNDNDDKSLFLRKVEKSLTRRTHVRIKSKLFGKTVSTIKLI